MSEHPGKSLPPDADQAPASERRTALEETKSNAWTDLALTVPIFVGYHLGVVTLSVRNAADIVTAELVALAANNLPLYWGLTVCIGLSLIAILALLGRGQAFELKRFGYVAVEGVLYAIIMRFGAAYIVGSLRLAGGPAPDRWAGVVMSLGAGFYEEVAFRAGLYGLGALALRVLVPTKTLRLGARIAWAVVAAAVFSGWHYVGELGDAWDARTFVFRLVCGLFFTVIFVFRGFAPAVWTHALYDIWALALQ